MRYILLTTIFLTSIFAQGQMDRRNMSDADKMEVRKQRMEQLSNQKESTMIGVQTSYLNLTPDLVNYASSIFIDVSTALNFVILRKKPTYFLTCDELVESRNLNGKLIDFYTIYFSRPKINIDRKLTKKFCHVPLKKNSLRRYDNYINKYIKNYNSSKLNIAQEIANSI